MQSSKLISFSFNIEYVMSSLPMSCLPESSDYVQNGTKKSATRVMSPKYYNKTFWPNTLCKVNSPLIFSPSVKLLKSCLGSASKKYVTSGPLFHKQQQINNIRVSPAFVHFGNLEILDQQRIQLKYCLLLFLILKYRIPRWTKKQ